MRGRIHALSPARGAGAAPVCQETGPFVTALAKGARGPLRPKLLETIATDEHGTLGFARLGEVLDPCR